MFPPPKKTSTSSMQIPIKIVILGGKRVGKSAITVRFLTRRYIGDYSSLKDQLYQQTVDVRDGLKRVIEMLDVSGDWIEKTDSDLNNLITWCHGIILVYDVSDRHSFHSMFKLMHLISLVRSISFCPILLLGNKQDKQEVCRRVEYSEGKNLAAKFHATFAEVSAAECCHGIQTAFDKLIHHLMNLRPSLLLDSSSNVPSKESPRRRATNSVSGCSSNRKMSPSTEQSLSSQLSSSYPSSSASFFPPSFMMSLKRTRNSNRVPRPTAIMLDEGPVFEDMNSMQTSDCESASSSSNPGSSTSSGIFFGQRSASIDVPLTSSPLASHQYLNISSAHSTSAPIRKKSWTSQFNRFAASNSTRKSSYPVVKNNQMPFWR